MVHRDRPGLHESLHCARRVDQPATASPARCSEAIDGADVFIGVSAPNILDGDDVAPMAEGSIVFALANPVPEIDPGVARQHAAVVATGRSDYPNQINNVLAFPGVFRGLLDASANTIDDTLLVAAAEAIAATVHGRRAQRELHHPERLPRRRAHRRRRRGPRRGPPGDRRTHGRGRRRRCLTHRLERAGR